MLRFLNAGESHGECLVGILEGMPSGLKLDIPAINKELARRQSGYGRGARMGIEKDKVKVLSGVKEGKTLASPIALFIKNRDHTIDSLPRITKARPGHADLAGAIKYNSHDIRDILERASARKTAMTVGMGAVCKLLLSQFGIDILSHVIMLGGISADTTNLSFNQLKSKSAKSPLSCADKNAEKLMLEEIDRVKKSGDSLGGIFEIRVINLPVGLGSHVHSDRRLDARLAHALVSISAIKGVEFGLGFAMAGKLGSQVHDRIFYNKQKGFSRGSNNAGGIEGGMSNGEPLILRCVMKPISTLRQPLESVDIKTKAKAKASVERADVCALPAAGVVGEAVVAFEIARAMREKFGGDSLGEMKRNYEGYQKQVKNF